MCLALIMPERAIPVLEEIDQNGSVKARFRAWETLERHRQGELGWINGLE